MSVALALLSECSGTDSNTVVQIEVMQYRWQYCGTDGNTVVQSGRKACWRTDRMLQSELRFQRDLDSKSRQGKPILKSIHTSLPRTLGREIRHELVNLYFIRHPRACDREVT